MNKKEDFPSFTYTLYINSSSESQKVRELLDSVPVGYKIIEIAEEESVALDVGNMIPLRGLERMKEYFVGKED